MKLREDPIIRRLFVMNSFDGILTVLGIVVGAFSASVADVRIVLLAGIGATIAMGISGFSGAYMTEYAERRRFLHELERKMLLNLEKTVHGKRVKEMSFFIAVVDGFAPLASGLICLMPFSLVAVGLIQIKYSYYFSFALSMILITLLGALLGKISKESMIRYAAKMLAVGLVTFLIIMALGLS